jgi:D-xylose transport system substrate-binding protein
MQSTLIHRLKTSIFLFITFSFILAVTFSCSPKKPLVGFMVPHTNMKRYLIEKEEFSKMILGSGADVLFMDAGNDEQKQIQQFDELIDKGIDIVVLDPVNRFNAAQMVRKAHDKGIKVISYDRLISNADVDAYVSFDAKMTGRQMAEYVLKLRPNGNYMILGGDKTDINAIGIDLGQQQALETSIKSGTIKVVYNVYLEKWSADDAKFEVENYIKLTGNIPDVILAASDGVSNGVVDALIEKKLQGKVLVTGNGGELGACKNIVLGNQTMTVYKPVKKLAVLAASLAIKMLKNDKTSDLLKTSMSNGFKDVPSCLLETIPVDTANLRSTVLADGMVTEEELK